jgi:hypothetical protein
VESWYDIASRRILALALGHRVRLQVREVYDCGERVVDTSGDAVADVELQVGKQTVYTGATGEFELTVGKRRAYGVPAER